MGSIQGKAVAQLYLSFPAYTQSPVKQLRGFDKVSVLPGATQMASFTLTSRDLSYWDGEWKLVDGVIGVSVGASSRDILLTSSFTM